MTLLQGQAHGKAILIGEHAVVYGVKAIALPLPQLIVEVTLAEKKTLNRLPQAFNHWFAQLAKKYLGSPLYVVNVEGSLPLGAGVGSSAALSVAALRALQHVAKFDFSALHHYAHTAETFFHGNPSGIDVETVLSDVPIIFSKQPVLKTDHLIGLDPLFFELWFTSVGPSTAQMIALAKQHMDKIGTQKVLTTAENLVEQADQAMRVNNLIELADAMNQYQQWLESLGVSTQTLDRLCQMARHEGALAAKITGAGGGGAVITLWEKDRWLARKDNVAILKQNPFGSILSVSTN